jgi:hypothetical protein
MAPNQSNIFFLFFSLVLLREIWWPDLAGCLLTGPHSWDFFSPFFFWRFWFFA